MHILQTKHNNYKINPKELQEFLILHITYILHPIYSHSSFYLCYLMLMHTQPNPCIDKLLPKINLSDYMPSDLTLTLN